MWGATISWIALMWKETLAEQRSASGPWTHFNHTEHLGSVLSNSAAWNTWGIYGKLMRKKKKKKLCANLSQNMSFGSGADWIPKTSSKLWNVRVSACRPESSSHFALKQAARRMEGRTTHSPTHSDTWKNRRTWGRTGSSCSGPVLSVSLTESSDLQADVN